ncbi:probable ATP-dependent RNA helicase DDX28 [Chrysoperla carnea]|uniref:probable ATP-dependent RNA helicase DDX28 n=1 Tax=Chrysoperla carnea TaxID=189513 RepID=UPI001D05C459|nr:probable ATP-dependent RNA helicase DDX28 [Chrysoperla carnea]
MNSVKLFKTFLNTSKLDVIFYTSRHLSQVQELKTKTISSTRQLINCKRREFDLYEGLSYSNYGDNVEVKLASKGWNHKKSIGDWFILYPRPKNCTTLDDNRTFEKLGISKHMCHILKSMDITTPTKIQSKAIPIIFTGKNCIVGAQTGSGKTLAYLLPMIERLIAWKKQFDERPMNSPLAVILLPSRELTYQIGEVINHFARDFNLNVNVIIGGRTKKMMLNPEFNQSDIVVASLGAISKLTTTGIFRMENCRHLVLDEADTLLDDSFYDKLHYFLKHFRLQYGGVNSNAQGTQLTLVSATISPNMKEQLNDILPVDSLEEITLNNLHSVMEHVPQKFIRLGRSDKPSHLLKLIKENQLKKEPVIIFSNKSSTCDWISMFLNSNGINCINLNGDMSYHIRSGTFQEFQDGFYDVISCTDIGSRGLDTTRVKHVLNYEFPMHTADYIHRAGRVGRIGSPDGCYVTNFVSGTKEVEIVQKIENAIRQNTNIPDVNGNITQVISNKMFKSIRNDISNVDRL